MDQIKKYVEYCLNKNNKYTPTKSNISMAYKKKRDKTCYRNGYRNKFIELLIRYEIIKPPMMIRSPYKNKNSNEHYMGMGLYSYRNGHIFYDENYSLCDIVRYEDVYINHDMVPDIIYVCNYYDLLEKYVIDNRDILKDTLSSCNYFERTYLIDIDERQSPKELYDHHGLPISEDIIKNDGYEKYLI